MWKLGSYNIKGKVVLAPMAGITNVGYRTFMVPFGADLCVTEMVSDMGLIYENEETNEYVMFPKKSVPTGVQLFGHDPKTIAKAALLAQKLNKNIAFFDVNFGCPAPKVVKTGAGSALLKDPQKCGEIIRELKKVTTLPVTGKIRLGWNDKLVNFMDVINALEEAGIDAIAIHARTREQCYAGLPNFALLKDLRNKMRVPLIVSGNIYTLDDAINALDITGADAVMVARGGMGHPFLIRQIKEYYESGKRLPDPTLAEQIKYCRELGDCLIAAFGEKRAMRLYRSIAPRFFSGYPNMRAIKKSLTTELTDKASLAEILSRISV